MAINENKAAVFMQTAIKEIAALEDPAQVRLLDFGCGGGGLVRYFRSQGYDAYGCDIGTYWEETESTHLAPISQQPYHLPYEDNFFDVVISTSVLEHAQNKEDVFAEIHRVLKPNGYSMHLFPSKWYLPAEPHIYVPLANFFWPTCPKWWIALWAIIGIRSQDQHGKSWREVTEENFGACTHWLSYWSNRKYRALSEKIFGNYSTPTTFCIQHGYGGVAQLIRKLPFRHFFAKIAGATRTNFIVQQKRPNEILGNIVPTSAKRTES